MKNLERILIANQISKEFLRDQGDNLRYVGVVGSTSKKRDSNNSDLDMIAVFRDRKKLNKNDPWISYYYKDIIIGIGTYTLSELDKMIRAPNYKWPYIAEKVTSNLGIYSVTDIKVRYRKMIENMDQKLFINGANIEYLEAFSGIGKIRRHFEEMDIAKVRSATLITFARRLDNVLALINRGFFEGDYGYRNLERVENFKKVPIEYVKLSKIFWYSNNITEIYKSAEKLWKNFQEFAKEIGLNVKEEV